MLENRSFDHMLGYLSLAGRRPDIDGLRPELANEHRGRTHPVHHLGTTAVETDPHHSASAIDQQIADGTVSSTPFDHTSIIKTVLSRCCPDALDEPQQAETRRSRLGLGPQYPGLRVAQVSHLGGLLTRAVPRPALPRGALLHEAPARGRPSRNQPGPAPGKEERGGHPLNDLQKSILAAAGELRRRVTRRTSRKPVGAT